MRLRFGILAFASASLLATLAGCAESNFADTAGKTTKGSNDKNNDNNNSDDDDDDDDSADGSPLGGGENTGTNSIGTDGANGTIGGIGNGIDGANGTGVGIGTGDDSITIPGIPVEKVGVNFEDQGTRGDRDHNDAVLCFTGAFKVDATNVVSAKTQQVIGTTSSHSGCNHTVRVDIIHADGTHEPAISFGSRDGTPVIMNFRTGSKLEVYMTGQTSGCDPGVEKTMHNQVDCVVAPNVCNTTGG